MSELFLSHEQVSVTTESKASQNIFPAMQAILGTAVNVAAVSHYDMIPALSCLVLLIGSGLVFSGIKNWKH